MFPFGPRLSGVFCLVWGQRDIPHLFLIGSATVLADIPSSFTFLPRLHNCRMFEGSVELFHFL
jgi:hypothetical protein